MSATTSPAVEAAARARRQATVVAALGAAVPTIVAAQGMTSLAVDVLGWPVAVAVALASFLELALVASALLARAAALAGRPGGADALAVWVISATSGVLSGVHELMQTAPDGTTTWSVDPGSLLAAVVRVVAPLVAAWLWERVLRAARAEQAERTLAEVRRDRRYLAVARAALSVRRLDESGRGAGRRARRAARRMDRAHVAALRATPPAATLADVLAAVGQVDHLPAATSVAPLTAHDEDVADNVADDVELREVRPAREIEPVAATTADTPADLFQGAHVVDDFTEDVVPDTEDSRGVLVSAEAHHWRATVTTPIPVDDVADDVADVDDGTETLALAVEVMREQPDVTGAGLADELTRRGRPMSVRSGQRWRGRALDAMEAAPTT